MVVYGIRCFSVHFAVSTIFLMSDSSADEI